MPELPTGSLTFLFTDIEGSTRLWEQQHAAMRQALARHDALLRSAIEGHRGHVFKTGGDGFCAAFPDAAAALQAAVAAQWALRKQVPQLRVRMALHTGEAELREGDYFGPALSRVKRLQDAGHGGQVLLSRAAVAATRSALPEGTNLRPLGTHRLRGFSDPEAIWQLLIPGLPSRFPPLVTLDVAFRRGVRRAAVIAGIVVALLGALALTALDLARREAQQRRVAEERQRTGRRLLYAAQMNLAGQALDAGNLPHALELVERQKPRPGEADLRGFAWRYLHAACRGDERFTLTGHTDKVNAVAIPSDGRLLASGGEDQSVRLWDLASRRSVAVLPQRDAVTAVAFSPDGRLLAAGAGSGPVALWNVTTRRRIATLKGSTLLNGALTFSPDGRLLAAGSGREVRLWDLATRRVVATLPGDSPTAQATALAFSPDGRLLAYAFMFGPTTVKLWDVATKRVVAALDGHAGFVFSAAFSPDGKTLATGSGDNSVRLWDLGARQTVGRLVGLAGVVQAVAFSADGKRLATGSGDGVVRLWDPASRHPVRLLKGHRGGVASVAFTPDGPMLASGSEDHTVKLWNTVRGRDADLLRGHSAWVWSVAFSPDSKTLVSAGGLDGTVRLWDAATGRAIRWRKIVSGQGERGGIIDAVFSPEGRYLAFCGRPPAIQLWDAALQHEIGRFEGHTIAVRALAFSPDGKLMASGGADNIVRLWEVASRREVARLAGLSDINSTLTFSPDGGRLALSGDGTVRLWDLASRRGATLFQGESVSGALAFSPDGRALVAGGSDGRLRWWDLAAQQFTARLPAHAGGVARVVFSPDGKELATVGFDNTLRLWDPLTRQEILALKGHDAPVNRVAFSPDGSTLATAGADRTVRLWRADREAETTDRASSRPAPP